MTQTNNVGIANVCKIAFYFRENWKKYKKKQSRTIYRSTKRLTPLSLVKGTGVKFFIYITIPSYLNNYEGRFQNAEGSSYTTVFYSILH
jgi:hypothetical protein